jgi:hypothetical protein
VNQTAGYMTTGTPTASTASYTLHMLNVTVPVRHHGQRKDTALVLNISRQRAVELRDALDAALQPTKEEIIDEMMVDYESLLSAELEAKVADKRAELEALSVEELTDPTTKRKCRTIDDE